ncbi:MAG TPA: phosphatidate cytidylyltransferase [Actinomycetota bacterium]|nr:phosphatidate cytidylyltransferase [Actinomycetota bacterium]
MTEDEKREGVDDLFGDLDDFFAPIDDVDWPEEGQAEAGEEAEEAEAPADAGEPDDEEWAPAIDIPDEEELVGEAEIEPELGAEIEEPQEPAVAEEPEGVSEEPAEEPEAGELSVEDFFEEDESEPAGVEEAEPEPTAEMSGDDWERLRSVLGEDEDEGEPEEGEPEEVSEELSVEDLRAAPAPYENLREPAEDAGEEVLAEEAVFESEEDEPQEPEEPEDIAEAAGPTEAASAEEVEAAAAHFASGIEAEEVERDLLSDLDERAPAAAEVSEEEPAAEEPAAEESTAPDQPEDVFEDEEGRKVMRVSPRPPTPLEEEEEPLPLGGAGAPTWQEPAAYAADEDLVDEEGAPPSGRNLGAAVASGVILAAAAVFLLAIGKGPFVGLAIVLVLLGQGELYAVLRTRGFQPAAAMGLLGGLFVMIGAYTKGGTGQGEAAMLFGLALVTMLSILWYMAAAPRSRRGLVANVASTVFGVMYAPFLASFALLLLAIPGDNGRNLLLTVVGLTVLYDVCAYGVGTFWGDRPLAPTISPRKSWEGAIGATFIVVLVALAIVPLFDPFDPPRAVGLAIVIAIAAPLGDLAESAIKRDLGVKDMGSLLPGHGGVLDRLDAILFTAPAAYYFLRLVL